MRMCLCEYCTVCEFVCACVYNMCVCVSVSVCVCECECVSDMCTAACCSSVCAYTVPMLSCSACHQCNVP